MNYKHLIVILLLTPFTLIGQTTIPYPAYLGNIDAVTDRGGGLYDVTVTVNDQSGGYNGNDIDTTNFVLWQNCGRYEIDSVLTAFSSQVIVRINDTDVNGAPIFGQASILQESPQNIGFYVAGILDSRNQCIASYYTQFIGTGSGSGGADTLFLADGTVLVNGDTIPTLSCSTERFTSPFDFNDRVVVNTVSIDSFELLDVFINGVYVNASSYTISSDSLIFSSYTVQNSDEIFVRSCQNGVSSSSPTLNNVLSSGNNAGGLLLKNIGDPFDQQDAVTLNYFENNDQWLETVLPIQDINFSAATNDLRIDDLGTILFRDTSGTVKWNIISSPVSTQLYRDDNNVESRLLFTDLTTQLTRNDGVGEVILKMELGTMILSDVSGNYELSELDDMDSLYYQDGTLISEGDTLNIGVKAAETETIENSNFTANLGVINIVDCSGGAISVTPPSSPQINDSFAVVDGTGNAFTNNITVNFSGASQNFHSSSQNYVIDLDNDYAEFVWVGATTGWIRKR